MNELLDQLRVADEQLKQAKEKAADLITLVKLAEEVREQALQALLTEVYE